MTEFSEVSLGGAAPVTNGAISIMVKYATRIASLTLCGLSTWAWLFTQYLPSAMNAVFSNAPRFRPIFTNQN